MSNFRLYNIEIEEKAFFTDKINLVKDRNSSSDNYFSLIIGNNGTGKSRVLSSIARFFVKEFKEIQQQPLFTPNFNFNRYPEKVIAITNSISDKFPVDKSFRPSSRDIENIFHRDFKYNYLGTRNRINSFSNKALMNRALDILFENYSELDISRIYRHVFNYLDYEPIIKLDFRVSTQLQKISNGDLTPRLLFDYLYEQSNNNRFRRFPNERIDQIINNKADALCDFINSNRYRDNEILINFSEKNISRISNDRSMYYENVETYNILGILRKLDIVKGLEIKVYKKGGLEFNFNEASSGEANILSTLIALIPLIQDNSLILIDEPEISLHPLWQSQYINLLNKIFSNFYGCHIIIASHSHFLVTDLPPENSSVITLKNRKGKIISELIEESTFGWSAEDILLNVFGLPTTRNFYLSQIISEALELLADSNRSQSRLNSLKGTISEYYPLLKDNDPLKKVASLILKEVRNE
ncbi:AAA family ATPase [Sunxiuqinia elliptica]